MSDVLQPGGSEFELAKTAELTAFDFQVFETLRKTLWLPKDFKTWISEHVAQVGLEIPISQIAGFAGFQARAAIVATQESTTSGSYTDLATVGPELTGLENGKYVVLFGANARNTVDQALMNVSINGAAVTGDPAVTGSSNSFNSVLRARLETLSSDDDNSITAKYQRQGAGTAEFYARALIALKYANL